MSTLDTYTKTPTDGLTPRQLARTLNEQQLKALADIDAGLVRSLRPRQASAIQFVDTDGAPWDVAETVQRLEAADLVERSKGGTKWKLTPAGELILKRWGGAR